MKRLLISLCATALLVAVMAPAAMALSSPMNVQGSSPNGIFVGKGQHYFVTKSTNTAKWVNTRMRYCSMDYTLNEAVCTVSFYIDGKGYAKWPASGMYADTFQSGTPNAPGWMNVYPNWTSDKHYTWSWWEWDWQSSRDYAVTPTI